VDELTQIHHQVWSGYYEQEGEQTTMEFNPLLIKFGVVKGHGFDEVGEFDVNGFHTSKKVFFKKQYIGKHAVMYEGTFTHEGRHVKG